tara:strand:+ start:269 stop:1546 length:1278 start_codon:yes stop_codon:yes gene_type:complete
MKIQSKRNENLSFLLSFFYSFSSGLVSLFLPLYFFHVNINLVNIGTIVAISLIVSRITQLASGALIDQYSRKKIMFMGAISVTLLNFSLLFFLSELFFIIRGIIYGIASGLFWTAYTSFAMDVVKVSKLSIFNSKRAIARGLGLIFAPLLGGLIIFLSGFTTLFYVSVSLGIIPLIVIISLKDYKHLGTIPTLEKITKGYGRLISIKGFSLLVFLKSVANSLIYIWAIFIPIFLRDSVNYSFLQIGIILMSVQLILLPFQLPIGKLTKKFHSKWLIIPAFFLMGIFMHVFFAFEHMFSFILMSAGISGGYFLINRPTYVRLAEMTPRKQHGRTVALFEAISWGIAGIALYYTGEIASILSIKEVLLTIAKLSIGFGAILVIFHRKLSWKYGYYMKRHHLMNLHTPIDEIIDNFPKISKNFKETQR